MLGPLCGETPLTGQIQGHQKRTGGRFLGGHFFGVDFMGKSICWQVIKSLHVERFVSGHMLCSFARPLNPTTVGGLKG